MEEFFIAIENHPLTAMIVFVALIILIGALEDVFKASKNK